MKKLIAEFTGTFLLVLIGTGSVVFHDQVMEIGVLGIAIAFFAVVWLSSALFGNISGSHINPAVSLMAYTKKELTDRELFLYIVFQLLGGLVASLLLYYLSPSHPNLGTTFAKIGTWNTFVLETFLTFVLVFGILITSSSKYSSYTGFVAALIVGVEAYLAGPLTGASMNPARSIAPALVSGNLMDLWVYIAAPLLGSVLSLVVCRWMKPVPNCCPAGVC